MTITIGDKTLSTRRPADLDAQLVASTGTTAAEQASMLGLRSTPYQVARALRPFLDKDAPDVGALAETIAAADLVQVRADTVALLRAAADKAVQDG